MKLIRIKMFRVAILIFLTFINVSQLQADLPKNQSEFLSPQEAFQMTYSFIDEKNIMINSLKYGQTKDFLFEIVDGGEGFFHRASVTIGDKIIYSKYQSLIQILRSRRYSLCKCRMSK